MSIEEGKIEGFDRRSVIRDSKTGKIIKEQHYVTHISQAYGELLFRDGKCYAPNGQEIKDPRIHQAAPEVKVEVKVEAPKVEESKPEQEEKVEKKPEVSFRRS